uniref:Protein C10 n=1 Tax=Pyrodinium bahamense TaxID=73915 RepID=A0A7S0FW38_9DINO
MCEVDPQMSPLNTQAFWNEFMRRPDAKAAYQAERRLQEKKSLWLQEKQIIEDRSEHRKQVAEALEDAPADIKKLIAPMFHIRVVEQFLWMVYDESSKKGIHFLDKLRDDRTLEHLRKLREQFQEGGEERMQGMENQWYSICNNIAEEEDKKKEKQPARIDIHTLKHVLEFGQECKREGNNKFREGLYEEALFIYSQGDDMMKKWKVDKHLKNEHKWLKDYHLACLKNKAQAALKLDLFQTALEAAEAALQLDEEDHKAWYRKVQAQKGLGRFKEAEESLSRIEDIAQWCPDRLQLLRDCEAERKRIRIAAAKHKVGTKDMLGKAFEAGVFSADREQELENGAKSQQQPALDSFEVDEEKERRKKALADQKPLERNIQLTAALAGDLIDELADGYGQRWFQERVRKCARDSGFERSVFLMRLKSIAFEVQKPILMKWGFEGNDQGVREMTAAIREHGGKDGHEMPAWLKEKQNRCLELLYGGKEGGMLEILM